MRHPIHRREVLRLAAGLASLAAVGCSSRERQDASTPTVASAGTPASSTPGGTEREVRSTNGLLKTTLSIAPMMVPFNGSTRWALTVNGQTPGPTLVARPGDHLSLTLENKSGASTNLHTHGLGVSPSGTADNPFIEVKNGQSYTYEIDIPASHPGGTFWYHPHFHHHVAEQLFAGFFGLIVVEDAIDQLPAIAGAVQRSLLLHDTRIGSTEAAVMRTTQMDTRNGREGEVLVTGWRSPKFDGKTAELERWRILNASPSRFYRLALDKHQLSVIATDGGRIAAPVLMDELTLVPGERVELLVRHDSAGTFQLKSLPVDRGSMAGTSTVALASFVVKDTGTPPSLPGSLASFESLKTRTAAKVRELTFSMQGQMGGARFLIDGREFDAGRVDIAVQAGTTEDWVIRNTSPMDHPFHLHVWPFQLIDQPSGSHSPDGWKDVVNVPANRTVTVRIPFDKIKGKTVFHCHILDHEDMGMMGVVEVS